MSPSQQHRYAALLRGVNVGGNKKIAMADLRALLTDLGFAEVVTWLQSGNAAFTMSTAESTEVADQIETALAERLRLRTKVLLLAHHDLVRVIEQNPFATAEAEPAKHLVQFLFGQLTASDRARIEAFDATAFAPEELRVGPGVIYFRFPDGISASQLSVAFGKHIGATPAMTGRNWNTVRKLRDLTI